jgi:hypothetical protein
VVAQRKCVTNSLRRTFARFHMKCRFGVLRGYQRSCRLQGRLSSREARASIQSTASPQHGGDFVPSTGEEVMNERGVDQKEVMNGPVIFNSTILAGLLATLMDGHITYKLGDNTNRR